MRERGTQERQQTGGGATQTHRTREPHQKGQGGGAQQGRRGNQNSGNREPEWEGMGERAHGRQRRQKGWPGQPAPSLPGARATPAQLASGGGCLPQPKWAVCATGTGAHQGQTSREGEKDIWWVAGTKRGGPGHLGLTHTETQRGRLWTACGQRHVDNKNSQTTPATTSTSSIRQLLGAADAQTAHHATFSTAPTHQLLGSANVETTPTRAPAAAADRKQQPMQREERVTVQGPVRNINPTQCHTGAGHLLPALLALQGGDVTQGGLDIQHSPGTPTTGLRERQNDTSKSTSRSGRQNAAT